MTRQCIFCLEYENAKRKVEANLVFNLENKLLGVDKPLSSKGIHKECLNHLLGHLPPNTKPALFKFPLRAVYTEHYEIKQGLKPVWLLSKPLKFFLSSGCRGNGFF